MEKDTAKADQSPAFVKRVLVEGRNGLLVEDLEGRYFVCPVRGSAPMRQVFLTCNCMDVWDGKH